jgi:predicted amidohydrolase
MKIALAQFGAGTDIAANVATAVEWIERAAAEGAELVVLPEFFNTPYFPQYSSVADHWSLAETSNGRTITAVREAAERRRITVVATIYEEAHAGLHYDTAFVVAPSGEIVERYRKTHAPLVPNGYEKLYYTPGTRFPVFTVSGWTCGISICYEWRFPEVARTLAVRGAELIVMPFAARRARMWDEALRTRAWENQTYVAVCNKVGLDDTWQFAGNSFIADPFGAVVAHGGSEGDALIVATLDRELLREARLTDFNWRDRRPELYGALTTSPDELW